MRIENALISRRRNAAFKGGDGVKQSTKDNMILKTKKEEKMNNDPKTNEALKKFMYACMDIAKKEDGEAVLAELLSDEALAMYGEFEKDYIEGKVGIKGKDPDPANWSKDDIDEVVKRVKRGEKIRL